MSRTTLVTGATQGIGLACSRILASRGHHVVGLARRPAADAFPGELHAVDLGDRHALQALLAELCGRHRFTGLVNNVGLSAPQRIGSVDLESYDRTFEVNTTAAMLCAQALVPGMRAARFGRIVNVSSEVVLGMTARTAYAAAKAAVQSFSRTWALELAVDGITVNTVAPGPVDTALFALNNPPGSEIRQRKLDRIPVGRLGEPDDIANAVAFFMAEESSFVTGQCLYVCGGSSLGSTSFL